MKRLLVYSHDTYGLGNIRRMLAIVEHLVRTNEELCVLILSGSPMMQAFRLSPRIDYVKLPCLHRSEQGDYGSRYLDISQNDLIDLRADLILQTMNGFRPDLMLIDKKPLGVQNELEKMFGQLTRQAYRPRIALVLREILDNQASTTEIWKRHGYHKTIDRFYDSVLILGPQDVFDTAREYDFPVQTCHKLHYCGYLKKETSMRAAKCVRDELQLGNESIVVLTAGGGRDGYRVLKAGLDAILPVCQTNNIHLVMFPGPEMAHGQTNELHLAARRSEHLTVLGFTNDMLSYFNAADTVVAMAGYNTVTELLSLNKSAVLVPRAMPSEEQMIRASSLQKKGLFRVVQQDALTPTNLREEVLANLGVPTPTAASAGVDMNALQVVAEHVQALLERPAIDSWPLTLRHCRIAGFSQSRIF
jgi:predicted glycosyltransferase